VVPAAKPKDEARSGGGTSPAIANELAGDSALDFRFDEDVSISRTGNTTKAQIDMINAAEREFEESAKSLVRPATHVADSQDSAAKAAAVVAAVAAAAKGMPAAAQPLGDLDFRLDEGERPAVSDRSAAKAGKDASVAPSLDRAQAAIDLDKLDLSFGPDHSTFEDATPSVLDGQWHDAATKLDLAKAYQEMGDVEGAREILQEVLHEGDDTQKSEAQVLLAKLG
jgi:pilus assembly protein FimV